MIPCLLGLEDHLHSTGSVYLKAVKDRLLTSLHTRFAGIYQRIDKQGLVNSEVRLNQVIFDYT